MYFAEEMLKSTHSSFDGKRVAISGSGNVAQYAAQKVMELGGRVVSLSDSGGTLHFPDGMTDEQWAYLMDLKNVRRGRLEEMGTQFGVTFMADQRPGACRAISPCPAPRRTSWTAKTPARC